MIQNKDITDCQNLSCYFKENIFPVYHVAQFSFICDSDKLQRKLDGFPFPVYTTEFCPKNKTEWEARSAAFNCNEDSSYACLPNENITGLLEFCYPQQIIPIQGGKVA